MEALKGMVNTLERNKNVKMISEFWPYGLKKAGSSAIDLYHYLVSKGFQCFLLEKSALSKLTEEKVRELSVYSDDKIHYFNIFVSREHV
jgi:hypothetical protein